MRIAVFGANGPTARLLTAQAPANGHRGTAVTRQPGAYPLRHAHLDVLGHADGRFPARVDLAASMLAMLDDSRSLRTTVGVVTTTDNPTLLQWIRKEALAAK